MSEKWHINRIGYATSYETHVFIEDESGTPICGVWCPPGNKEQEANAQLIETAPQMAAALVNVIARHRYLPGSMMDVTECVAALDAAGVEHA